MNQLPISLTLERMVLAHTSTKGTHWIQDPNSGNWYTVLSNKKLAIFARLAAFHISLKKPGKVLGFFIASSACLTGLVLAIALSQSKITSNSVSAPLAAVTVPISLPTTVAPISIDVNDVAYRPESIGPVPAQVMGAVGLSPELTTFPPRPSPKAPAVATNAIRPEPAL